MMKSGRQIEGAGGNVAHLIVPLVIVFPFAFDLGQDKYPTPRHGSRTRTVSGRVDDASRPSKLDFAPSTRGVTMCQRPGKSNVACKNCCDK